MANLHSRSSRPSPCTSASSVAFFLFSFFSFSFASLCQKEENATLSSCFFPFVFSLLHFLSLFLFCFASQKRSVLVPPHIASHFHLVSSQKKKKKFVSCRSTCTRTAAIKILRHPPGFLPLGSSARYLAFPQREWPGQKLIGRL